MNQRQIRIPISKEMDISGAIIQTQKYADKIGFDNNGISRLTTAVSELARNIVKYAGTGEVTLRTVVRGHAKGIEIVVADRGPGIEDVEAAMGDGFSSSGTLGLGLPGVKRLMDEFKLESEPQKGTRVTVRKWV